MYIKRVKNVGSIITYVNIRINNGDLFIFVKEFKPFVDGLGEWKWSTDQTLLNYWVRKFNMGLHRMNWKWNGLFNAIDNKSFSESYFLHFFQNVKLPNQGNNKKEMLQIINGKV